MPRRRASPLSGFTRAFAPLRGFLLVSAAVLALFGAVLCSALQDELFDHALEDAARDAARYANAVLVPGVVRGERLVARPGMRQQAGSARPRGVSDVYVWGSDGGLVLSTPGTRSAGQARPGLAQALRRETTTVTLETGSGLSSPVFRVWSPVRSSSGRPLGVAEILLDQGGALGFGARVWVAVGLVLVTLWLALAVLVGGATGRLRWESGKLRDENEELAEATRRLEATLLETVETLNAAVEARDPYTAGHSQRVQRVALAIGRELGLPPQELSVLGTAAIFHDIGKIGIPDSILTKPDILSRSETEVMREHVTRGAEIVARIGSFAESVEAIRYHHERWDGLGYPEGLAGEEIPLEAAIVGLSDAWEAMTTDRPYATALPLSEALKQIELGRGRQFSPVVADAFLAVVKRRPAEILPPDSVVREMATATG